MSKIIISSDSTSDLSKELIQKYDIKIIPLIVNIDGKQFRDGVDITPDEIYASVELTNQLPKTAAANVGEFIEYFEGLKENEDDEIISFTISSTMSSTYSSSVIAAEEVGNVYPIDSGNLSTGIGLLILEAARLRDEGKSAKEIVAHIESIKNKVDASFVVDNVDYLYKGGRCSAVARYGVTILHLKPCIEVKAGSMGVGRKYRGNYVKSLRKYVADKLENVDDLNKLNCFVTHAGVDAEIVNEVYKLVKSYNIFENVYVTRAGSIVSSHCGRNTLGVLFIRNSDK